MSYLVKRVFHVMGRDHEYALFSRDFNSEEDMHPETKKAIASGLLKGTADNLSVDIRTLHVLECKKSGVVVKRYSGEDFV